jgi:hypothetical protein
MGLWNCVVCTKLNQHDRCAFCGTEKGQPFQPSRSTTIQEARSKLGTAIGFDERMKLHREVQVHNRSIYQCSFPDV